MAAIGVPTVAGVGSALQAYAVGIAAGVGFQMLSNFTGSGIIGGAVSAAIVGATVRGQLGDTIATMLGFSTGQGGLGNLGLGNLLPGLNGGSRQQVDPQSILI